jgi:PhnB protein
MTTTKGANGTYTVDGIPRGSTSITPFIALRDARGAVSFYERVFHARVVDVTEINGVVAHAVLDFGHGILELGETMPAYHLVAAPEGEDDCYSLGLYCSDADAMVAAAEQAGAVVREPLTTFVSGDRFASVRDPFGVRWTIMTRVEDLSEE